MSTGTSASATSGAAAAAASGKRIAARELLDYASASPAFRRQLAALSGSGAAGTAQFSHITPEAQGFLVALLVSRLRISGAVHGRFWILCPDLRTQERISNELTLWGLDSLFFPENETAQFEGALPDPEIAAERAFILHRLASTAGADEILVLNGASLDESVPAPENLSAREHVLRAGGSLAIGEFQEALVAAGFERVVQVEARGQFALRGGILDIFSWQAPSPVRIELFDNEIESIREFGADTQTSLRRIPQAAILLADLEGESSGVALHSCIDRSRDAVISCEFDSDKATIAISAAGAAAAPGEVEDFTGACYENPLGGFEAGDFVLQQSKRQALGNQLDHWEAERWKVAMIFNGEGEVARFAELVDTPHLRNGFIEVLQGQLDRGFVIPDARLAVISDAEIFGRYHLSTARRHFQRERRLRSISAQADFRDYTTDDLVVHVEYGIGRFEGLQQQPGAGDDGGLHQEVLVIGYADEARLYVPLEHAHLVSRYVGSGRNAPALDRLGSARWNRTREAAERAIRDYAAQLLAVHAEREAHKGFSHEADTRWQWEFENSFPYKETADQLTSIADTKGDMESPRPMDRLICGDVGFGKTEVAIRAAFKSVMSGRQVAVLVPTTVLAQQHYQTFRGRMSEYPITIELLSRFRTRPEQIRVVRALAEGSVDIVIGTHRLISKDVVFKKLGLVVIDEEQRFGVCHKERFKDLFRLVDVLTLSATPIPRTLYLSLMGARDLSTINTPPPNRYPVETLVCPYDERIIRSAIERELKRQGQVFFLHNRVQTIDRMRERIEDLVPGARIDVGHGQMDESELELVMDRFVRGETDILVCTTIIESGIDIPNANTIIIDRADRFGLADLYQLRGRVGRAQHKAYAILMLRREMITGEAHKRINAIKQYSSLGAGFKIAMRDLEIRGAGNLLGTQQSGHIAAVGFDLYCQLLKQSIGRLKGEIETRRIDVAVKIDFIRTSEAEFLQAPDDSLPAFIPSSFVEDARLRIQAYRQLAELSNTGELGKLRAQWRDRFGTLPPAVDNLLNVSELKLRASGAGISVCEIRENKVMLTRRGEFLVLEGKFPRLEAASLAEKLLEAVSLVKSLNH